MKRLHDQFTQTDFYREREAAILRRLKTESLIGPPLPGKSEPQMHDASDVIYYTGCVAGSLGLSLDVDNVSEYLTILRMHARDGDWPEIARLLSELYAHANEEAIHLIQSDPVLTQQPWARLRTGRKSPSAEDFAQCPSVISRSPATMPLSPV